MADRKYPKDPKDPKQEPNEPDPKRPQHKPEGREHQVHKEILERRWKGGPAPTSDASRRALEQWNNLPGSVVRPPTDITAPPAEKPSEPAKSDEDNQNDKEHKP
jgi:hypothetical protein